MTFARRMLLAVAVLAVAAAPALAADSYTGDVAHSSVNFKIKHFDVGYVFGRFDKMESKFALTPDGSGASFEVSIKADSVDTGVEARDKHLKGPDFFNAAEFGEITFKSTSVKPAGNGYEITGDLTLHGVTKPLAIQVDKTGEAEVPDGKGGKNPHVGLYAEFKISRSDFGMNKMVGPVADSVELMVVIDGVRK